MNVDMQFWLTLSGWVVVVPLAAWLVFEMQARINAEADADLTRQRLDRVLDDVESTIRASQMMDLDLCDKYEQECA